MLRFTLVSTLLITAACGQSSPVDRIDSSLKTPLKPGEAYSLARVTDDKYWISSIAVSDNYLFLATSWQGVYRMPKYGGALTAVEEDDKAVGRVAANRDTVFWNRTTFGSGDAPHTQVRQQPAAGGATSTLQEGDFGPFGTNLYPTLVATGDALYMMRSDRPGDFSQRLDRISLRDGTNATVASFPDTGGSEIPWPTTWTLTGDAAMQRRPIAPLVEAWRQLGVDVRATNGCPPVHVRSDGPTHGGTVTIDASVSSQFVSSLLLVGSRLENGLDVTFAGDAASLDYARLTARTLASFGIEATVDARRRQSDAAETDHRTRRPGRHP